MGRRVLATSAHSISLIIIPIAMLKAAAPSGVARAADQVRNLSQHMSDAKHNTEYEQKNNNKKSDDFAHEFLYIPNHCSGGGADHVCDLPPVFLRYVKN